MTRRNDNAKGALILDTNIRFRKEDMGAIIEALLGNETLTRDCKLERSDLHGFAELYIDMIKCGYPVRIGKNDTIMLEPHAYIREFYAPKTKETLVALTAYMDEDARILWRTDEGRVIEWYLENGHLYAKDVDDITWSEPYLV